MKTIYLNFTADNKNYLHSLVNETNEDELLESWADDLDDHEDFEHQYQGIFVQNQLNFNGQFIMGVNLSFPLYDYTGDIVEPKNKKLVCQIAEYVKSQLEMDQSDKLHIIVAAHGIGDKYKSDFLSTGNFNSPAKGLLHREIIAEIIKQFSFGKKDIEITLVACNVDQGNFVKNFVTGSLAKRFEGNIKLNRFQGVVSSNHSKVGYNIMLKEDSNIKMIPFLYDRSSLTDEGIKKFGEIKSGDSFPEMLFIDNKEKNNTFSDDLKI
jgi:hypothetical protein